MHCHIRRAIDDDGEAISQLITCTLGQSNAQDYPAEVIARVQHSFTPPAIRALMVRRKVYVALVDQRVVATASLEGEVVRSVFVMPEQQGSGLGRALMTELESVAMAAGVVRLHVPSSLTAQGFYAHLGYTVVREEQHGAERTFVMVKPLATA